MLHHGQRITKKEIELKTSLWPPDEFASLCNAITWASAQRQGAILPSFTERVYVKDKGIDAEYVAIGAEGGASSSLLSAGWNVLQYKLRDILAQDRSKIVSDLKTEFKIFTGNKRANRTRDYYGALQDIFQRNGHRPVRYILFVNIDLTRQQKAELQAIILEGYDQPETVHVVISGAADLAAFLNDLPHLRSAYFVPSRFRTWEKAWKLHQEEKLAEASVGLIGRGSQLTTLQSHLCDSTLRAVIVTGPTGVGKSRLVLEATKCSPTAAIIALDPTGMTASDLLAVESPGAETIVVIDNPDPKKAEEFVRQALSCRELKLVITLPTAEHVSLPNFQRDPRVKRFPLDPLTDPHPRELLKAAGATFEFGIESWIIAQANGNPGVLLMAAHAPDFRKSTSSFLDDVATTFEQQIRDELGERAVEVLRLISLLTRVNIHAPLYKELATLSSTSESHLEPHAILHEIPRLQRAGVVRVRGEYVEATPTLLANHLAKSALRGRYAVIEELFVTLRRSARFCLLERLRLLDSSEVLHFWDELFSSTGLFSDFQAAVSNIQVLYAVTGAASRQVARLLENGFASCNVEEIASLPAETKRSLLFILHDLVFRKSTSKSALNGILVLASSETGHHTSSLETFYSCFHPFQPQCPLPLEERLAFLRAALSPASSLQTQIIGLRAVIYGLSGGLSFVLHEGNGPEPFSTPPEVTWQATWDYWDTLFDLLIAFAHADQPELAELAQEALPNVLARYTLFGHMTKGLARFRQVAQECLDKRIPVSVSRLSEALIYVQKAVSHRQVESAEGEESLQQVKKEIADIVRLLEVGDFSTRLVRWASTWASDEQGEHMNELRALAAEALGQPHLLTAPLLIWLLSGEAKLGLRFFLLLGELDTQHFWLPVVEELGGTIQGAGAFAWYFSGLGVGERSFVNRHLDELAREGRVTGQAILAATAHFPGDSLSAKRVRLLLEAKRVTGSDVEYVLLRYHPWLRTLNLNDYFDLLKVTAEEDLRYAQVVVNSLSVWLYHHPKMSKKLATFAQQCLVRVSPNSLEDASYCDQLASKLVEIDVEIGFTLFEQRLHRLALATLWNPLSPYTGSSFWETLCQANRKRVLRASLVLATNDHSLRTLITGSLVECIDQELDATTLIEFANEQREHAWVVCESIAASKAAFWPLALGIFRHYSSDEEVTGRLHYAVRRTDIPRGVLMGLPGVALQSRLLEVQRVLSEMPLSARERMWMQEIERFVQAEKEAFERFESDIERQRIPLVEDDPSASERLWMLKKVLRNGKLNTLKRSISKEELLALLPALQLSEQERMQFEGQITKWE